MTEPQINEDGKYICLIDGTILDSTPEEKVRQQYIATLIDDYGYSRKLLRREVPIHHGSRELEDNQGRPIRADIAVYRTSVAATRRDQGQIKFVVECKKADEQKGYAQLVSYIFNTNAPGGVWTNGDDTTIYRVDRETASLLPFPELPRAGEEWGSIAQRKKSDLNRPSDVRRLFRLCNNKLYGRGMENSDYDLTMDMVRILLAKIQDESEPGLSPNFHVTPEEYETTEGRKGAALRVRYLFERFAEQYRSVFPEGEKIEVPDGAIVEVVSVLQPWSLIASYDKADDWDLMGAAYEQYTHQNLKRQRGQFFTNRLIVNMMVRMAAPVVGEKVLDPAGGSGGFTTAAFRYLRHQVIDQTAPHSAARERQLSAAKEHVYLSEISPRLVKLAKTAMLLNGDGHAGMTRSNSLGPYDELDDWLKARCRRHEPSVILTNPPFAGKGESRISDPAVLDLYQTGRKFLVDGEAAVLGSDLLQAQAPEILFFERALDWLKPGGRMGIVMPKSFLDTTQAFFARQMLFEQARLDAVITLHKNSFMPDTGVRTCAIFVTKFTPETSNTNDYPIYMATSQKVGQDSEGVPIYRMGSDGVQTGDLDHDLDDIEQDYYAFLAGQLESSQFRYSVNRSDIENRLNINPQYYSPHLNESIERVRMFDEIEGWSVTTLGQIEPEVKIFKGPRLKTENVIVSTNDSSSKVVGYFTPSAMLQDKRDSAKWVDLNRANAKQLRDFDMVTVHEGDFLLTRSGTIGRLAYVTSFMDGQIVSDDMIRVRIPSPRLRAYVAAFLLSDNAANQMLRNEYGAIQQHLEPNHVRDLLIPVPDSWDMAEDLVRKGNSFIQSKVAADRAIFNIGESGFDAEIDSLIAGG
ncbi:N-6 DNA methylase [Rathayibacter sp. VKM Ac-2928]|uniref:N-6 DNA methylase n=1 Tax=Rathayibacter sp. VKM Ac-2928 TaxID=2929479 RepID=UPI001FB547EE|nr:N-6 DNA methylase [Rathayibacter sp. VKM Ac-2928]MCJ1685383.1 N-6 DNA methylase [Rathayibacter sp. VKM Ac-2928]